MASGHTDNHVLLECSPSGSLNCLDAILPLHWPLDCYRAPSAIESAIARPYLALSRIHAQVIALSRLALNRIGAQPHDSDAISSKTSVKQARNKNAIEAAILNGVLERD